MNKRCTNSSCRKTFSTLNYGGQCPFCGKVYPQLTCARKGFVSSCFPAVFRLVVRTNHFKKAVLRLNLKNIITSIEKDSLIEGIKRFRSEMAGHGYRPGLKDSKVFCEALRDHKPPCSVWRLSDETRNDLPVIVPDAPKEQPSEHKAKPVPKTSIEDLELSVRAYNCLTRAGISTVDQLLSMRPEDLSLVRNLGMKSREEILRRLSERGLKMQTAKG